jgi:quercetin dioxygenase-like cupin family protein
LHTGYQVSGRLHVKLDDGTEKEYAPGDAYVIPPGHDAWVVGDEPVVMVDMSRATAEEYAKEE